MPKGTPTSEYGHKIREIERGITPAGNIDISQNGLHDVTAYATANVQVTEDTEQLQQLIAGTGTDMVVPRGTTQIRQYAFYQMHDLESIEIPEGVTTIGHNAFNLCSQLKAIEIPESVTYIGDNAFSNCSDLETIVLPDTIEAIGSYVFKNTKWLLSQPDGMLYIGPVAYKYKGVAPPGTIIDIREGTTCLAPYAFEKDADQYTSNIIDITFPSSLKTIGASALAGCWNLSRIEIPDNVTTIGLSAFQNCSNLIYAKLPSNLVAIPSNLFNTCSKLKNIQIPDTVEQIGASAFNYCAALASIDFPEGLMYIYI